MMHSIIEYINCAGSSISKYHRSGSIYKDGRRRMKRKSIGEKEDGGGEGYITIGVIIVNDKQYFYD